MKFTNFVFLVLFASMLAMSCKKDVSTRSRPPEILTKILGKWSVVNEEWSWTNAFTSQTHDSIYLGQPGDYYEFMANGNLFVREGLYHYTATYYYASPDSIQTNSPNAGDIFIISDLTEDSLSLVGSYPYPDGYTSHLVNLIR